MRFLTHKLPTTNHILRSHSRGVALIDVLIGTALMLLIFVGIAAVFQLSIDVITNNRFRAGAIALLNERMEYLRSLSYTQIGVIGGIPAGNVEQEETVTLNDLDYTRRTTVLYTDDPGDGLGAADTNSITADYKTIRVEVTWPSRQGERSVALVGRVSPNGVETAVPGGTLVINVVNGSAQPVSNAQVDIINVGTSPNINIRTYTNINGMVTFIGAPAASNYQIAISKPGYSSAQTYSVTSGNPNPNPRHLTIAETQTTTGDFVIDYVATKTIETYMQVREDTWSDSFADESKVSSSASTTIASGVARLEGTPGSYATVGSLQSVSIAPEYLAQWKSFVATASIPAATGILFRFYDNAGTALVSEAQLPGNAAGFSTTTVHLSGVSTTTYPALRVSASLSSSDSSVTPSIDQYSLVYDYGPVSLPNLAFTMRGVKTIGNNPTVYKYNEDLSSGSSANTTLTNVEADTYTLSVAPSTGYTLAESCAPQPEALSPSATQTTRLYVLPASTHSLLVDVRSDTGALLTGASVELVGASYDEILATGSCGQVFFDDVSNSSYAVTVTQSGFQPYTGSVDVSGATRFSAVLNAQ